jgi:uncharacterized protein YjbI with pentapeptide repeats
MLLVSADLSNTDLSDAYLTHAILAQVINPGKRNAESWLANLAGANLTRVILTGAKVLPEQLKQARTLEGAMLPQGEETSQ